MARHTVLVADDEPRMQRVLEIMLNEMGLDVLRAGDGRAALETMDAEPVDLVITDLRMPVMDGLELLSEVSRRHEAPPVIVVTAHGTIESAVAAMKQGAVDYILRPFEVETVELAVRRALDVGQVRRENRFLRAELARRWDFFVGDSPPMRALYELIAQVAPSDLPVLITGETGTGKELVAHAVHQASGRQGLFVPINCAAIPESMLESELFGHVRGAFTGAARERTGKFEISDGGSVFLDEITEMSGALQARLLRVLQERYVERVGSNRRIDIDLRVIAATNRDPRVAVAEQRLREDLYYRLEGIRIEVPPLRERGDDIEQLAEHFLRRHAERLAREVPVLDREARTLLRGHCWPGNVRELDNLMARVVLLSATQQPAQLLARELDAAQAASSAIHPGAEEDDLALQRRVDGLERKLIEAALARAGDNKAQASRLLEISERTLWYKLKKLGMR